MPQNSGADFGCVEFQQLMLDMLGDRDYDGFEHDEFKELKDKIGFGLYGPPQLDEGYDEKQREKISSLADIIRKENNLYAKYKDYIVISIIYNCTVPLDSEKMERTKKYHDYNPNTDINPIPLFILRKCKHADNPCRIIIDSDGRVYETYQQYIKKNKLHKCLMVLPKNGKYQEDDNGKVMLEYYYSPACGTESTILNATDKASTAAGLVSGSVFVAAAIPAVTVAPFVLMGAAVAGATVGVYSIGRSSYLLYDKLRHKQSISFANSEARGAYINIVAGTLGFVGAGANFAISQLAAKGVNIGKGATTVVNVIGVTNIGANGVAIVNSGYDLYDQWFNENQKPNLLVIIQLSSAIFFFGHAVYNFKLAGTIIEESQAKTLKEYQDSLRSNRHRKTFNKLMKETIKQNNGNTKQGQSQVIQTISKINQNKDEVFASLTRLNKEMNKNNVKFSADGGQIKLNGVAVDFQQFAKMDKNEAGVFLSTLSSQETQPKVAVTRMESKLQNIFNFENFTKTDFMEIALYATKLYNNAPGNVIDKIINTVSVILSELILKHIDIYNMIEKIFPGRNKYIPLLTMVNGYFQKIIDELEKRYNEWLQTKDPNIEEPWFATLDLDSAKRILQLFNYAYEIYVCPRKELEHLIKYVYNWISKEYFKYEQKKQKKEERKKHSSQHTVIEEKCCKCGGSYYVNK